MKKIIQDTRTQLRRERQENERLRAQVARQDGWLEYVAMMTDVDLPEAENGEEGDRA